MNTKVQTHLPYALVTALAMIIIGVILEVTKLTYKPGFQWIGVFVFLAGIILNATAFSKANGADVTFGQVFGSGFKATAIITLIMVAWSFIVLMIFPGIYDRAVERAQEEMSKNPKMSDEQVDMAVNFTKKNFKTLMVAGALFGTLLTGVVASLIGAAVVKKAPRQKFDIQ